jgi:RNA polymerase sigma-70 factor (ECF subfamily)
MANCGLDPPRENNHLDGLTDEQLVESLRLGRTEAFDALYHRYKRAIYTFCLKLTGDRSLAEDATHDAFIKMYQNIATLTDPGLFRTWLYAIARNQIYTILRRQRVNGQLEEESVWNEETPSSLLESKEEAAIISRCIEVLKPEYQRGVAAARV